MRLLLLDATMAGARLGVASAGTVLAMREDDRNMGLADLLPDLAADCLAEAGIAAADLDAIGVTIGPGSFTGIRAAIALAQGIGAGASVPVHGLTLTEIFHAALPDPGRDLWIAVTARRGRVFLERDGQAAAFADTALPAPSGPVALAGDRAADIAAILTSNGHDALATEHTAPNIASMAAALATRLQQSVPPRPALPLYVDPPEAKLPSGGLRPSPA